MLIDWFTVAAQLVNFLALIWLLKRFLYQPILSALAAREARINAELDEANNQKQIAQQERAEFLLKNQAFEQQRAELFKIATEEAKIERQRLLNEARWEAEKLRSQQQEALKQAQQNLISTLSQRTQTEIFAIARQVLSDLGNVALESQIIAVFKTKLQQLNKAELQSFISGKNLILPLKVNTCFDLSPVQQVELEQVIREVFGNEIEVKFSTSTQLLSGIELSSDGQKIAWSMADYLAGLEKNLTALLQARI